MSSEAFVGFFVAFLIVFAGGVFLGATLQEGYDQNQAISRGYGLYCPNDGKFAFVGECYEK